MTHLQTRLGPVNVYYKPSQVRLVTRLIFPVRGREGGREGGGLGNSVGLQRHIYTGQLTPRSMTGSHVCPPYPLCPLCPTR